jgi:nucleotide-binding universal stress UspA family protein
MKRQIQREGDGMPAANGPGPAGLSALTRRVAGVSTEGDRFPRQCRRHKVDMITQAHDTDRRIVVGVDGSRGSRAALRWALGQARLTGATVEAIAAWQSPAMAGYSYGWMPTPYDGDIVAASADKVLAETVADLAGAPDRTRTTVTEGPPAQVLLNAAAGADMLVVGSRGHGAFAGMLLGSVSQHCIQHAPCAVVVIPDEDSSVITPSEPS